MHSNSDSRSPSQQRLRLEDQLQQREYHLAELIDEVVVCESHKESALKEKEALQQYTERLHTVINSLLRFHVIVSRELLLPCCLDAMLARAAEPGLVVAGENTRRALEGLAAASPQLAPSTRDLLRAVLELPRITLHSGGHTTSGSKKIEQAVILSTALARKEQDLLDALHTAQQQLPPGVQHESSCASRSYSQQSFDITGNAALLDQMRYAEAEREALRGTLDHKPHGCAAVESLVTDRKHLEQQLLQAQRRTLEEQEQCRILRQRVMRLEEAMDHMRRSKKAEDTLTSSAPPAPSADISRLQTTVAHLQEENCNLAEASQRMLLNVPRSVEEAAAAKRRAAQLEEVVGSLRSDLHIMESRLSVIQDQREAERQRIIAQHEQENRRLRREREECQVLMDKLTMELQRLTLEHRKFQATSSVERL